MSRQQLIDAGSNCTMMFKLIDGETGREQNKSQDTIGRCYLLPLLIAPCTCRSVFFQPFHWNGTLIRRL